jgi:pimeloyl-ACP methyl ester carboxylesterase
MPVSVINGTRLYSESRGKGAPVVLVHGSWGDHHNWDAVVPGLARNFRVLTYDRRGHSLSERLATPGSADDDVADLADLIRSEGLQRAHVVGNSFGALIALKLLATQPDVVASLTAHEPPLIGLLENDPGLPEVQRRMEAVVATLRSGKTELGAEQFVETVALGPGMWEKLSPQLRQTFVFNAPTWLDEMDDREAYVLDLRRLAANDRPALLSRGDQSPPFFNAILDKIAAALPHARRHTFTGAGHVPHLTHPNDFATVVGGFLDGISFSE